MSADDDLSQLKAQADAAYAASNAAEAAQTVQVASGAAPEWWSTQNAMTMCSVVLLFGVLVLALATYLMRTGKAGVSVLRIFGTVLVVTMTTFLVVAGYDNAQLAAPLGLMGTIAGYLLGKESGPEKPGEPGKG